MDKIYNPKKFEESLYYNWEKNGYFKPRSNCDSDHYCIMMPPPNITGTLHIGHAFQHTIMDIIVRYQRMQGKNTLWQVGTDHAGIATQIIVEKTIFEEEGKVIDNYGKDELIKKIWQWKTQFRDKINYQMRRLGDSVDWNRERFTMDEGISIAVREAFIRMYKDKLIYKGKRLVNWDTKLCTAISDLEIRYKELKGSMWYIRYPLENGLKTSENLNYLVVATTRPETIFGDTAVAVHPEDSRYNFLIGHSILVPIVNRSIPIISNDNVDMIKGTGCVKITPAHDFNDYKVGKDNNLPMINIFTLDGKISQKAEVFDENGNITDKCSINIPKIFQGLELLYARKAIVKELSRLNFLQKVKNHNFTIPYSDRSGVIIVPMLTNQWYIRTKKLSKIAIEAVELGQINFIQEQYKNIYLRWMYNIQDWCISRQILWGHRIPAWYDEEGKIYVGHDEIEIREKYKLSDTINLIQENDVLDTWFSSGIWTFSTLGWPKNTKELQNFHPTNVIVSGFDIIFFWIARMIMLSMYLIKDKKDQSPQVPFKTIYITGLIRDEQGKKMSKSQGNIIDPLDIVDGISLHDLIKKRTDHMMQSEHSELIRKRTEKNFSKGIEPYGADALRFTLASLASSSRDIYLDMNRLKGYRNFCNKLWHASRFVLNNIKNQDCGLYGEKKIFSLSDRWILVMFNKTVKLFRESLDNYRIDIAARTLYEFTWNNFCDWYIELAKPVIIEGNIEEQRGTRYTLLHILEALLRLAHPIIPFITEIIWKKVNNLIKLDKNCLQEKEDTITLQKFPIFDITIDYSSDCIKLEWIKKLIIAIRTIRMKMNISPNKILNIYVQNISEELKITINSNLNSIFSLSKINKLTILSVNKKHPVTYSVSYILDDGAEILINIPKSIDTNTN